MGHVMTGRVIVHMAVPGAKRALAATMAWLSGLVTEHSIPLITTPGGPSFLWDTEKGYSGDWWGASQALAPGIAQAMLTSGYMLGTESWFAAFDEDSETLLQHNLPNPPANASFEAFLAAAGLSRVEPEGMP